MRMPTTPKLATLSFVALLVLGGAAHADDTAAYSAVRKSAGAFSREGGGAVDGAMDLTIKQKTDTAHDRRSVRLSTEGDTTTLEASHVGIDGDSGMKVSLARKVALRGSNAKKPKWMTVMSTHSAEWADGERATETHVVTEKRLGFGIRARTESTTKAWHPYDAPASVSNTTKRSVKIFGLKIPLRSR